MADLEQQKQELLKYMFCDEWKAFEAGNKILREIRRQYEGEQQGSELGKVQQELWTKLWEQYPWVQQFEKIDCSVIPEDLGWGLFCYLEEMTGLIKKYMLDKMEGKANRIVTAISEHLYESGTLASAAQDVEMDKQEMSRLLKRKLGVGTNEYCNMLKIQRAKVFLTEDGLDAKNISERLGYLSEELFVKKFREQTGCRPDQYIAETKKERRRERA